MMKVTRLVLTLVLISQTACTVIPTVQYRAVSGPNDMQGMTDSYYRDGTVIDISMDATPTTKSVAGQNQPAVKQDFSVVARRVPFLDQKIAVKAISNWRSSTLVAVNKFDNTDMVSSIGVEVSNNAVKAINAYGGAIASLVSLAALDAADGPCIISGKPVSIQLPKDMGGNIKQSNNGKAGCISIEIGPVPADALPAADIPFGVDTHNYYYSACRDAEVTILQGGGQQVARRVRIADPKYVQLVQFPVKGTLTAHTTCGFSVKTLANATDEGPAIVDALVAQAKAIKEAIEAAKK